MRIKKVTVTRDRLQKLFNHVERAQEKFKAGKRPGWPLIIDVYTDLLNSDEGWKLILTQKGPEGIHQIWLRLWDGKRITITDHAGHLVEIVETPYQKQFEKSVYRVVVGSEGEFVSMGYGPCSYCKAPNGEEHLLNVNAVPWPLIKEILASETLTERWVKVVKMGADKSIVRHPMGCPCHSNRIKR